MKTKMSVWHTFNNKNTTVVNCEEEAHPVEAVTLNPPHSVPHVIFVLSTFLYLCILKKKKCINHLGDVIHRALFNRVEKVLLSVVFSTNFCLW